MRIIMYNEEETIGYVRKSRVSNNAEPGDGPMLIISINVLSRVLNGERRDYNQSIYRN